jgi:hypothetical protein
MTKKAEGEEDKEEGEDVDGSGSGDYESLTRDGGEIDLPADQLVNSTDGKTEGVSSVLFSFIAQAPNLIHSHAEIC